MCKRYKQLKCKEAHHQIVLISEVSSGCCVLYKCIIRVCLGDPCAGCYTDIARVFCVRSYPVKLFESLHFLLVLNSKDAVVVVVFICEFLQVS